MLPSIPSILCRPCFLRPGALTPIAREERARRRTSLSLFPFLSHISEPRLWVVKAVYALQFGYCLVARRRVFPPKTGRAAAGRMLRAQSKASAIELGPRETHIFIFPKVFKMRRALPRVERESESETFELRGRAEAAKRGGIARLAASSSLRLEASLRELDKTLVPFRLFVLENHVGPLLVVARSCPRRRRALGRPLLLVDARTAGHPPRTRGPHQGESTFLSIDLTSVPHPSEVLPVDTRTLLLTSGTLARFPPSADTLARPRAPIRGPCDQRTQSVGNIGKPCPSRSRSGGTHS